MIIKAKTKKIYNSFLIINKINLVNKINIVKIINMNSTNNHPGGFSGTKGAAASGGSAILD